MDLWRTTRARLVRGTPLAQGLRMPPLLIAGAVLAASLAPPHGGPVWLAGLPPGAPARVLATPDGLLLGSDEGLYRLKSGGWTLLMTRGGVVDLARAPDGTWIASGAGLYWWPDGAGDDAGLRSWIVKVNRIRSRMRLNIVNATQEIVRVAMNRVRRSACIYVCPATCNFDRVIADF